VGIVNTELNENLELAFPSPIPPSGAQHPSRGLTSASAAFKSRATLQLVTPVIRHRCSISISRRLKSPWRGRARMIARGLSAGLTCCFRARPQCGAPPVEVICGWCIAGTARDPLHHTIRASRQDLDRTETWSPIQHHRFLRCLNLPRSGSEISRCSRCFRANSAATPNILPCARHNLPIANGSEISAAGVSVSPPRPPAPTPVDSRSSTVLSGSNFRGPRLSRQSAGKKECKPS
jgi:hypothetical protein